MTFGIALVVIPLVETFVDVALEVKACICEFSLMGSLSVPYNIKAQENNTPVWMTKNNNKEKTSS